MLILGKAGQGLPNSREKNRELCNAQTCHFAIQLPLENDVHLRESLIVNLLYSCRCTVKKIRYLDVFVDESQKSGQGRCY